VTERLFAAGAFVETHHQVRLTSDGLEAAEGDRRAAGAEIELNELSRRLNLEIRPVLLANAYRTPAQRSARADGRQRLVHHEKFSRFSRPLAVQRAGRAQDRILRFRHKSFSHPSHESHRRLVFLT
jgi:hypothetical protein